MSVILISLFIIGLFFGSFYNVVALRLSQNESIIFPGSHCPKCEHRLSWYELIPVFSYIFLRGKCHNCHKPISLQYPIVEVLTGILFALSFYIFGFSYKTIISIIVVSVVIITIITDIKYMVILDEVLLTGSLLIGIVYYFQGGIYEVVDHVIGGLFMFLVLLGIKVLGDYVFKQESMGWGDVKLSFFAGLLFDWKLGLTYLILASFLAFPYAVYSSLKKKTNILPFGPFLALSLLIIFWNYDKVELIINLLFTRGK